MAVDNSMPTLRERGSKVPELPSGKNLLERNMRAAMAYANDYGCDGDGKWYRTLIGFGNSAPAGAGVDVFPQYTVDKPIWIEDLRLQDLAPIVTDITLVRPDGDPIYIGIAIQSVDIANDNLARVRYPLTEAGIISRTLDWTTNVTGAGTYGFSGSVRVYPAR